MAARSHPYATRFAEDQGKRREWDALRVHLARWTELPPPAFNGASVPEREDVRGLVRAGTSPE